MKEKWVPPKIDYRFNHYRVKPIHQAKSIHLSKSDAHMGVDLFPENKEDRLDARNKNAIQLIQKMEGGCVNGG